MNYHSNQTRCIRIFVKDFDPMTMTWQYVMPERVAIAPARAKRYKAFDFRRRESIIIHVFVQEFRTLEPINLYELTSKQVSNCLDRLYIHSDHFGYSD